MFVGDGKLLCALARFFTGKRPMIWVCCGGVNNCGTEMSKPIASFLNAAYVGDI